MSLDDLQLGDLVYVVRVRDEAVVGTSEKVKKVKSGEYRFLSQDQDTICLVKDCLNESCVNFFKMNDPNSVICLTKEEAQKTHAELDALHKTSN